MPRLLNALDPAPYVPTLPKVTWWSENLPPWRQQAHGLPVDADRTERLADYDDEIRLNGGVPLQLASPSRTTTQVRTQPPTWSNPFGLTRLPLQEVAWVEQETTDFNWYAIDPVGGRYWEASEMGPVHLLPWLPAAYWRCGYLREYDLKVPWDKQKPSITGGGLPMWPMVPSIEALDAGAGGVQHALHFVVGGGYSDEPPTGPARKTDGEVPGHPLRAGERLTLTAEAHARFMDEATTAHDLALVWAMNVYGLIVNDRTANVGHAVRLPADPRLNVTLHRRIRLTDLQVRA